MSLRHGQSSNSALDEGWGVRLAVGVVQLLKGKIAIDVNRPDPAPAIISKEELVVVLLGEEIFCLLVLVIWQFVVIESEACNGTSDATVQD